MAKVHRRTLRIGLLLAAVVLAPGAYAGTKHRVRPNRSVAVQRRIDMALDKIITQIDVQWHAGDYDSVCSLYETALTLDPKYLDGWVTYGWFLWAACDRPEQAMKVLQQGLAHLPNEWQMYDGIGQLEYHRGRFLSAAQWAAKAIGRKAPWTAWHFRAHCLEYAGERVKCVALWKEIVKRFPDDGAAKLNLKRVNEGRFRKEPAIGVKPDPRSPKPSRRAEPPTPTEEPLGPQEPGSI